MKTDRFMQGILVSDEEDVFAYPKRSSSRALAKVTQRLAQLKRNLKSLTYLSQEIKPAKKPAVFSKTSIDGNVEDAINDMWQRIQTKR